MNPSQPNPAPASQAKKTKLPFWVIGLAGCGCAIFGLLIVGAIAIPAFISYIKRSKAAEAHVNVQQLGSLVEGRCRAGESFVGFTAGPLPTTPSDLKTLPPWSADPGFVALGFAPTDPTYYSYQVGYGNGDFRIIAHGDLDADGAVSEFMSVCDLSTCTCAAPTVLQELE